MSSLKSYFRKKHKYEIQSDLKDMTAEQIVSLNPSEVGYYIEEDTGGVPLAGVKKKAMFTLLAIKRQNKATPNERARQKSITNFLEREGIKSNLEVDKLMANTQTEMVQENISKIREQLELKDMTNRIRALDNKPPIPDTEEESMIRRVKNLGGKRKSSGNLFGKTVSKRKRREKTRKGRKSRKSCKALVKHFSKTNRRRN
jgi:hypothetical protein